jgi:hypothetical protein
MKALRQCLWFPPRPSVLCHCHRVFRYRSIWSMLYRDPAISGELGSRDLFEPWSRVVTENVSSSNGPFRRSSIMGDAARTGSDCILRQ